MYEPMPNYDHYSLLLPMFGNNNGIIFSDFSSNHKPVSVVGNTKTVTAQSKYYGSSGYFDGSGDYLSMSRCIPLSGDFTIGAYIRVNSVLASPQIIIAQRNPSSTNNGRFLFGLNASTNNLYVYVGGTGGFSINGAAVPSQTFTHVALSRSSNVFRLFINGELTATSAVQSISIEDAVTHVGDYGLSNYFGGYIQDLFVADTAIWTANFTPPTHLIESVPGGYIAVNAFDAYPYSINLSITETLDATDFTVVVTNANTGFIMSKTTVSGATPTIPLSTNDPCMVTLYPDYGTSWQASTGYALNDKVFPTDPITTPHYYICTTAGTSGATEPTWPLSGTVNDGTAVWTYVEELAQPITHGPLIPS